MKRIKITILKCLIKLSSILDNGSMSTRTTRLLARLVDLEHPPIVSIEQSKYRIVK